MISQYKETHILSSPFTSKSLVFVGDKLISPTNTKLNIYQLDKNRHSTLPFNSQYNVRYLAASPDGSCIIIVDEQQNIIIYKEGIIGQMKSKFIISCIKFSIDGKMVAICRGNQLVVYKAPTSDKSFQKLEQIQKYQNKHQSQIKGLEWSPDCRFILTWGKDNSIILNSIFKLRLYEDVIFQSHKFPIVNAFFVNQNIICTLDQLGKLCVWRWVSDYISEGYKAHQKINKQRKGRNVNFQAEKLQDKPSYDDQEMELFTEFEKQIHQGRYVLAHKKYFKDTMKNFGQIKSAEYHVETRLLLVGLRNGNINLFKFQDNLDQERVADQEFLELLQTFQIAEASIDVISFNKNADWIALGLRQTGQLIVWEWRSQSYILNQSQLSYETTVAAISNNLIATGSTSGTIRLWDTTSYLCIAKFTADNIKTDLQSHSSKVTAMQFDVQKNILLSCSLDGTIRAFDTQRLKCFRVMQPEVPNQLQCLAYEGELVCVGGFDPYEIYCFHLQRGNLVEVISGHKAPIISLCTTHFEETLILISASWDKTIRIHDLYSRQSREGAGGDVFEHNSEITAIAVRNDGLQLISATMKGELQIWDIREGNILGTIDVDRDIQGGRATHELVSAQNNTNKKHFTTICYSQDGIYIIGGGNSKYVCMYDVRFRILIKKFIVTNNQSLEGMNLKVNFNKVQFEYSDEEERKDNSLPGAKTLDVTKRNSKKVQVQVHKVQFSYSNRQFIIAHSEGVSVYGLQEYGQNLQIFDPLMVDENINIDSIQNYLNENNYTDALINALKLNQHSVSQQVFEQIIEIDQVMKGVPDILIPRLINLILRSEYQIERNLLWSKLILLRPSTTKNQEIQNSLKELQKTIRSQFNKIQDAAQSCIHQVEYIKLQQHLQHNSESTMEVE